jgi:hypothetical protein
VIDLTEYGFRVEARAPATEIKSLFTDDESSLTAFFAHFGFKRVREFGYMNSSGVEIYMSMGFLQPYLFEDNSGDFKVFMHSARLEHNGTKNYVVATVTMKKAMPYIKALSKLLDEGMMIGEQRFKFWRLKPDSDFMLIPAEHANDSVLQIDPFGDGMVSVRLEDFYSLEQVEVAKRLPALNRLRSLPDLVPDLFRKLLANRTQPISPEANLIIERILA